MKRYISVVSLFSVIALLMFSYGNSNNAQADAIQTQLAGTIRNAGDGWKLIDDASHSPVNIQSVSMEKDRIKINHNIGAKKVGTFIVTPDETMAKEGYTVGISGGVIFSYIYIYDKNRNVVDPQKYVSQLGNIWIYGLLTK